MLVSLQLFDQKARLRGGANGDAEVASKMRIVAPVTYQDTPFTETTGDFRGPFAKPGENEIGGAGRVRKAEGVESATQPGAVRAHHLRVAAHIILLLAGLQGASQGQG